MAQANKQRSKVEFMRQQARAQRQAGKIDDAIATYEKLLRKQPGHVDALAQAGTLYLSKHEYHLARPYLQRAHAKRPDDPDLAYNLGLACYHCGDVSAAIAALSCAIALNPQHEIAYFMLARAWLRSDANDKRLQAIKALALDLELSDRTETRLLLAETLILERDTASARGLLKPILAQQPDNELALYHFGKSLIRDLYMKGDIGVEQVEPIVKIGRLLLDLHPNSHRGHHILSESLAMAGENDLSIAHYEKLTAILPDAALCRTSVGTLLLKRKRLAEGWREITYRSAHAADFYGMDTYNLQQCPASLWRGELFSGAKLLVVSEQGIGDQLLHAQMICDLLSAGLSLTFTCNQKLLPLMRRSFPQVAFYADKDQIPQHILNDFDFKAELFSLGRYLRSDVASLETNHRYLKIDKSLKGDLRQHYLQQFPGKKLIGIAWKSYSKSTGTLKSTSLVDWEPILTLPDCQFINIQYGDTTAEVAQVQQQLGIDIFTDQIDPFTDLDAAAAQIAALDQVISVSNASVHLAGQLGIPTWVLLDYRCLWHWFESESTSCWYDSIRLFRQTQMGGWRPVIQQVAADLRKNLLSVTAGA